MLFKSQKKGIQFLPGKVNHSSHWRDGRKNLFSLVFRGKHACISSEFVPSPQDCCSQAQTSEQKQKHSDGIFDILI